MSVKFYALGLIGVAWLCACNDYSVPEDTSGTFDSCCEGLGTCVSSGLVDPDQLRSLDRDTCNESLVCIPSELVKRGSRMLESCTVEVTGAEGRCVPECLPEVAERPGLRRDDCRPHRLCAPCYDPLNGLATRVCKLGADEGPREPAVVFDRCCGELGRCVPSELIEETDREQLSGDECKADELCTPLKLASSNDWVAQSCTDEATGAEGRCLPACLPGVAERAGRLSRGDCQAEHLCTPCYDPVTRESTGACSLGGDPGPKREPHVFAACCGTLGRCVPPALVDEDDRAHLAQDSCQTETDLCVPEPLARDERASLVPCVVAGTGGEGRCVPACLPDVAKRAQHLEQSEVCASGEVCAPCFDPVDGASTGACELGGDPGPSEPPFVFADCCAGLGRCVSDTFVPDKDLKRLHREDCEAERDLCAPEGLVVSDDYVPATCTLSDTQAEGRCLPACLPEVEEHGEVLTRESCGEGELCGPCFDPSDGHNTGACNLGGDPGPSEAPIVFADCCGSLGRCVPARFVESADRAHLERSGCAQEQDLCLPEALLLNPDHVFESCRALGTDAEARCLPACLPEVQARADVLAQQTCPSEYLCTPCFDPFDGTPTGACELGGDMGSRESPETLSLCCGELGRCVPKPLLTSAEQARLAQDSCASELELCAPEPLARDRDYVFPDCVVSATGAEGRCVPACLPQVAERADRLAQDGCAAGHLCTPCYDPIDGASTGACTLGGDAGPTQPPVAFDDCCGALGKCVPSALIDPDERAQLAADSCSGADALCVPTELAKDREHQFLSCVESALGAEGRCLPACLPDVAARAQQLRQDSCGNGLLCVPCYEPVDGELTGACSLGGDSGPNELAQTYGSCCSTAGRCVPETRVPEGDRDSLGRDNCTRTDALCVPAPLARDADYAFASCSVSATGAEGRCLPDCLPDVAARAGQLRADGCGSGALCAPCYEPVDGNDTGACAIGADTGPTQPPALFDACCSDAGRCIPRDLIPDSDASQLSRDTCTSSAQRCVPTELARDEAYVFASCHDEYTNAEGRCLLACLPQVQARAQQLTQASCPDGARCAPCFEPFDGTATRACELGGDPGPQEAAYTYPHCCGDAGRCVPLPLVPSDQRQHVNGDGCSGSAQPQCVPLSLARAPDDPPPTCHDDATGAEGRCLMRCLPEVQARAEDLRQGSCQTDELCVPCYEPVWGEETGACSLTASDAPREAKVVFGNCCSSHGRCVPSSLVTSGDIQILSRQECTQDGWVCAPDVMVEGASSSLPSCQSVLGPSTCLDECFVPAGLAELIPAGGCTEPDRCVPCYVAEGLCP